MPRLANTRDAQSPLHLLGGPGLACPVWAELTENFPTPTLSTSELPEPPRSASHLSHFNGSQPFAERRVDVFSRLQAVRWFGGWAARWGRDSPSRPNEQQATGQWTSSLATKWLVIVRWVSGGPRLSGGFRVWRLVPSGAASVVKDGAGTVP